MKCPHCKKEIKTEDYIKIICKKLKKEFRIYKWENKKFKEFPMPKGFNWAQMFDFIYLYDNDLIELEKYPVYYFMNKISKKNGLSGLYLDGDLNLDSIWGGLADSGSGGRVIISKKLK